MFETLKSSLKRIGAVITRETNSKWFLSGAILGVFAFAVARGLTALPLSQYGFNIWIFILIDLITTPPYVLCINRVVRGIRTMPMRKLIFDGVVIALSFIAPYWYLFWSAGQQMPTWTLVFALCVIVGLAAVGPIRKLIRAWKGAR